MDKNNQWMGFVDIIKNSDNNLKVNYGILR